jgi:hypothetical protein
MSRSIAWEKVSKDHVALAIHEYDELGPATFFERHGFGPTTTYDLLWADRTYPPKAILGRAYELSTGERLVPIGFEGGRTGAVRVLEALGFTIRPKNTAS